MAFPFSKFFGKTVSEGAAFAAGLAISPTLLPLLQALENETWSAYPDKPPSAATMALGVAQGQVDPKQAAKWARETGYSQAVFDALVNVANVGPGIAAAFDLWRRGVIDQAAFRRAALRAGLEQEWIDALWKVRQAVLDPADLARGIHKSLIPDPGLLATPQPEGEGNVKAYPVYPIDALAEAQAAGYDRDHLGVLVGLQGNPMGAHEAAQATFRGVLEPVDFERAISEGNTRNEWGPAIFEQSRQIPSPVNYVEGFVRNWISKDAMYAGAARHGMTQTDTDLIFLNHGRPLTHNQVFIGSLRGGVYDGPIDAIDPHYLKSLQESDMRPEWYNLSWAGRYHYPPFFQTVQLYNKGLITEAVARHWLEVQAYAPDAIDAVLSAKAPASGSAKALTPTQIRSAVVSNQITKADGLQRLEALGYSAADAQIVLNNPARTPAGG